MSTDIYLGRGERGSVEYEAVECEYLVDGAKNDTRKKRGSSEHCGEREG